MQQVGELTTKVKTLDKKGKKAPDDLKGQLKSFLEVRRLWCIHNRYLSCYSYDGLRVPCNFVEDVAI